MTELALIKSIEQEDGRLLYSPILKEIGEVDLVLENFLQYLSINPPLKRKDTVHKLIDELFKKYQTQLEAKEIKWSKKFEEDLPEAIIPDEPLNFILESLLQYGIKTVIPKGEMECSTKSSRFKEEGGDEQKWSIRSEGYVEIRWVFEKSKKRDRLFGEIRALPQREPIDLILRLAEEIVQKNGGVMEVETAETSGREWISIKFPTERRKRVYNPPIDQCIH